MSKERNNLLALYDDFQYIRACLVATLSEPGLRTWDYIKNMKEKPSKKFIKRIYRSYLRGEG